MLKSAGWTIALVFFLGGGVFTAKLFGYTQVADYLEAQANQVSYSYQTAKDNSATTVAQ